MARGGVGEERGRERDGEREREKMRQGRERKARGMFIITARVILIACCLDGVRDVFSLVWRTRYIIFAGFLLE